MANDMKGKGVTVYAVGFANAKEETLDAIASSPASTFSYHSPDIDGIIEHTETLAESTCVRIFGLCVAHHECAVPPQHAMPALDVIVTGSGYQNVSNGLLRCNLTIDNAATLLVDGTFVSASEVRCILSAWPLEVSRFA